MTEKSKPNEAPERAAARFRAGCNCAQAVLSTFASAGGIEESAALRLAALFGGGIGRSGETCGAVTGALMALGLRLGEDAPATAEAKERLHATAREMMAAFRARHGALRCRDLLGCDLSTPEGYARAHEERLFEHVCEPLVRDAASIVLGLVVTAPSREREA